MTNEHIQSPLFTLTRLYEVPASVNCIKISWDGKYVICGASDGMIRVYSLENLNQSEPSFTLKGHTAGINDIVISPIDSDIVASCSDDLSICLWSLSKRKCIRVIHKHTYHITSLQFTTRGNILVSGSADETIIIWDCPTGKALKTLAAHADPIMLVALSPDNSIIASASYDGLMRLFDTELGQCLKTLTFNSTSHGTATALTQTAINSPILYVNFSPNGKYILSLSLDGKIRLWDYMENKVAKTYSGVLGAAICEKYMCAAKFITGKGPVPLVVLGSDDSGILIWDVQTKRLVGNYSQGTVLDVDVYNGGSLLVGCTREGRVEIYEGDTNRI